MRNAPEKKSAPEKSVVAIETLLGRTEQALQSAGVAHDVASQVAAVLVDAEARGISSHGLVRLPSYVARVRAGLIDAIAVPKVITHDGACILIDGRNAFGAVVADFAMRQAEEQVRSTGVAWAVSTNANHLGAIGYYVRKLARRGLVALMWCNAAPSVAAYNGRRPILGTNPVALAAPRTPDPIVLDMATSAAARGRIRRAATEGRSIPMDWAIDSGGKPTADPASALAGALLPLGGPKGYGLSVFVDLLSGVLGGGASLDQVFETTEITQPASIAFTLVVVDPFRLTSRERYSAAIENFVSRLKASGDGQVPLPGEREDIAYARARTSGVPVAIDIMRQFEETSVGA